MKSLQSIDAELRQINTIVTLTDVFQGIASAKISQVRNQVLQSQGFFSELWDIYTKIRVDSSFHFGRRTSRQQVINKELYVLFAAEAGLSGDIDQRLISEMLLQYSPEHNDIIVVGRHGANLLRQQGVTVQHEFSMPEKDIDIDMSQIVSEVQKYKSTTAYYQSYKSLFVQNVQRLSLLAAVQEQGRSSDITADAITDENYIFEPSTYAVIDYLEQTMVSIMLGQIILESQLSQYASRFRAMSAANDRAKEDYSDTKGEFNRVRRLVNDERMKEIVSSLRRSKQQRIQGVV